MIYTLYEIDENKKDYKNIYDFYNTTDAINYIIKNLHYNITSKHFNDYVYNSINDLEASAFNKNKYVINNVFNDYKYFFIKEKNND